MNKKSKNGDREKSGPPLIEDSLNKIKKHWMLYLVILVPFLYIVIFKYIPMYGVLIAFKNFQIKKGILGSPWAGMKYFKMFFDSPKFWQVVPNTIILAFYLLIAGFPIPIILALSMNEVGNRGIRKSVQMITYAPHFISTVVFVSIIQEFLSLRGGYINLLIQMFGNAPINFMGRADMFRSIFVWTGVWQNMGYGAIIYMAALSTVDSNLYEAAIVDGASKVQRIIHISIPSILPTIVILLILRMGRVMNIGFEKVYLMQTPLNLRTSEVIATYVYKIGILSGSYSFSTAIGLFNSIVNLILIATVNSISRKISEVSLW